MTFRKRLSLANAYRKGFLRIVKDTGSVAGAISLLIKTYKGHGISAVLSVLRARLKNYKPHMNAFSRLYQYHLQLDQLGNYRESVQQYKGYRVLFVSHDLSLTGAPRMLYYAALAVFFSGGLAVVLSPEDGEMRKELEKHGIEVLIDERIVCDPKLLESIVGVFDLTVVNTMMLSSIACDLSERLDLNVLWWLHEALPLKHKLDLIPVNKRHIKLLCVSEYARSWIPLGFDTQVLHNGIPDEWSRHNISDTFKPFTFSLIGSIEPNKGQDIFFEAISSLPIEIRKNCRFLVAGGLSNIHQTYWKKCLDRVREFSEITYLGSLNHHDVLQLISHTDILVCCSKDDAFPLVVLEAAMMGCPSLLSKSVGVAEVFEPSDSCIVFEEGNVQSLIYQMSYAYSHKAQVKLMGEKSREVFEGYLTFDKFSERFLNVVSNSLANKE